MKSRIIQKRIDRRKVKKKKIKIPYKYISIIFILIISVFAISALFFNNHTSKISGSFNLQEDSMFSLKNKGNSEFSSVYFTLNRDNTLTDNIYIYEKTNDKYFKVPTDVYVSYDEKYYSLKNIFNVIKQNRSETASNNLLGFLQDLLGIRITAYAYNYTDKKNDYYVSNNIIDWQSVLYNDKNYINLDSEKEIISDSRNIKTYDEEGNDYVIRKENIKYKNIKVEIYNSTNLSGLGNTYSRLLQNTGFSVVRVLNYDTIYPGTTIFNNGNTTEGDIALGDLFNNDRIRLDIPSDINTVADYIVILGGDAINLY